MTASPMYALLTAQGTAMPETALCARHVEEPWLSAAQSAASGPSDGPFSDCTGNDALECLACPPAPPSRWERCPGSDVLVDGDGNACRHCGQHVGKYGENVYGTEQPPERRGRWSPHHRDADIVPPICPPAPPSVGDGPHQWQRLSSGGDVICGRCHVVARATADDEIVAIDGGSFVQACLPAAPPAPVSAPAQGGGE